MSDKENTNITTMINVVNEEYMVVLDWDDTLFPSHIYRKYKKIFVENAFDNNGDENRQTKLMELWDTEELRLLIKQINDFLLLLINFFEIQNIDPRKRIFIVSNGSMEWILKTITKYYETIKHTLNKTTIISAPFLFKQSVFLQNNCTYNINGNNNDTILWKQYAIYYLYVNNYVLSNESNKINDNVSNKHFHIISIGDGYDEYFASNQFYLNLIKNPNSVDEKKSIFLKRIKFVIKPTILQLIMQIKYVKKKLI